MTENFKNPEKTFPLKLFRQESAGSCIWLAIDPGMSGAVAYRMGGVVETFNCPMTLPEMVDSLKGFPQDAIAIVEQVGPMPGNGVSSTWKFSGNYHTWLTALYARGIPYKLVRPQQWMPHVKGLPADKSARKHALRAYSQRLNPNIKVTLANADALAMLSVFERVW